MPRLDDLPPAPRGRTGWPWTKAPVANAPGAGAPAISIVTPSYNQGAFLEEAIRSVLLQGYEHLEYYVLDGGSTDGSVEIIHRYERWLTGWTSEKDRGQSDAINRGLRRATGTIATWLNCDDRLAPGALDGVARAHAAAPDASAWVGRCRSVTPSGRLIYVQEPRGLERDALADWGRAGQIVQPACFFSRAAAADAGFLDEALHFAMDVDFWLKLAARGRIVPVPELWATEIIHPGAKTSAQRGRSLAELHRVQLRHGYDALAFARLAEELQEYETLKRGTLAERAKLQLSMALQPLLSRLPRRNGS